MAYRILLTDNAKFMLRDIQDRQIQEEIAECIDGLVLGPEERGKLILGELAGCRSVLCPEGRYRVVYRVIPPDQVIVLGIHKVGGVRRIVERLKKLLRSLDRLR